MDGLPDQRGIGDVELHREGLCLHAHGRPEVGIGGQDGHVGVHIRVAHQGTHAGAVVVQQFPIRPPGVLLVIVAAVLHPAREGGFLG